MVVVSIIAILSSIAVPNFSKMSARAKQTAARVELSGVYTAEQSFFAEFSEYHVNLPYVGYIPDGWSLDASAGTSAGCPLTSGGSQNTRYYSVGFQKDLVQSVIASAPAINCTGSGNGRTYYLGTVPGSNTDGLISGANSSIGSGTTSNLFQAAAVGKISSSGSKADIWTINQTKNLVNVSPGI